MKQITLVLLGVLFFATHSDHLLWGQCSDCDPEGSQQESCVLNGNIWYIDICTCEASCDTDGTQQASCSDGGGSWDSNQCTCTYPPPPPCKNYTTSSSYTVTNSYCSYDGGELGESYTEYDYFTEYDTYDCYGNFLSSENEPTGSETVDNGSCEA